MKVRWVAFVIVLGMAALSACSDRSPASPSSLPTGAPANPAVSTVRTPVALAGALAGVTYQEAVPSCPGPSPTRATVSEVEGTLPHLGLTRLVSRHCYVGFDPGTGSLHYVGTATLTAANGDQLAASFSGDMSGMVPTPSAGTVVAGTGSMTVTGGTGRFADASGGGTITVDVTIGTPPMPIRIAFDASIVY